MSRKPSLAESLRSAIQASEPLPGPHGTAAPKAVAAFHAATRVGKKRVTAPIAPEDHKRLKRLAIDREATTEALLIEAIHDLFVKYD